MPSKSHREIAASVLLCFGACLVCAQRGKVDTSPIRDVVQSSLITPGSTPFHLKARITGSAEQSSYGQVEIFWAAPDQYRRTIHSNDFNQTLVVNGKRVFEQDSTDYFPIQLRTLITAMLDPKPILEAVKSGDRVLTLANGAVNESGVTCFGSKSTLCAKTDSGLRETVGASGHSVDFRNYELFDGKRVARVLTNAPRLGEDRMTLTVDLLEALNSSHPTLFKVKSKTKLNNQLHFVTLPETDLRHSLRSSADIIWPQPLDGAQAGPASFYLSIDHAGNVREVQRLYTANERTNDSATDQLMKWKFKPVKKDGLPAQAEGIVSFTVNTRAFGPSEPLTNEEARKLATGIVEPDIPAGKYPPGTTYTLWASIDAGGKVIEAMAGDGPHELFTPCYSALRKWQFHPIMENGQPRPYRAQIAFRAS
jgi:hypothetical protein